MGQHQVLAHGNCVDPAVDHGLLVGGRGIHAVGVAVEVRVAGPVRVRGVVVVAAVGLLALVPVPVRVLGPELVLALGRVPELPPLARELEPELVLLWLWVLGPEPREAAEVEPQGPGRLFQRLEQQPRQRGPRLVQLF